MLSLDRLVSELLGPIRGEETVALFWGQECPLCGVKMSQADRLFATSHFIADSGHDLWRFSDAAMHWDCYANWRHRRRFGRMYFESKVEWIGRNPY